MALSARQRGIPHRFTCGGDRGSSDGIDTVEVLPDLVASDTLGITEIKVVSSHWPTMKLARRRSKKGP
ncbi:hypothetical protein [Bradyrhizobium sp. Gha]|uniref:hypothetical protein n=1 Tax=Bradyrhizobium sp. Gha TaxID=1855318 RepID=UPI0011602CF2|nr:hypothetical protein [Bradyrhizobium sp. Gha]